MHKVISDCADLKIKMAFFKWVHSCVPLNLDSCGCTLVLPGLRELHF